MVAKIHHLLNARRGTVQCPQSGVVFPQVYRFTGYGYKFKDGVEPKGALVNDDDMEVDRSRLADFLYTISMKTPVRLHEPRWEPISKMDNEKDDGLVFVRHHVSRAALEGYIDAVYDTEVYRHYNYESIETSFGFFTLMWRPSHPGALGRALIYITKIPDPLIGMTEMIDWYHVVNSQGNLAEIDDTLPVDEQEHMQPLHDLLRGNKLTT